MIVADGSSAVAGRLAAFVAKKVLAGEEVAVINAEKAVISGDREEIVAVYRRRRGMTNKANPEKAMKWPRRPDLFFKKIVAGMMPKHSSRGKKALHRLKAYIGAPPEVKGEAGKLVKTADQLGKKYVSIEEVCKELGWTAKR